MPSSILKTRSIGLLFRYGFSLFLITRDITPQKYLIHRVSQAELNPSTLKDKPAAAEGEDTGKSCPIAA
jgi:hypothetical protein